MRSALTARRRLPALGLAVVVVGLLAGCTRPVAVPEPTPDDADRSTCTALVAALPDEVEGGLPRTVEPGVLTAAWGDPPITLRCGVAAPPGLTPASECLEVNGVGWFGEEATGGMIFTTIGRAAFVEVSVPTQYPLGSGALVDLGATVTEHDPVVKPCR